MTAKKPEDCDLLFGKYAGEGDLESLCLLYEDEATFVSSDRSVHTGKTNVRKILSAVAKNRPQINMSIFKVVHMSNDLAVLYNDWTSKAAKQEGHPTEIINKAIEIVRRQPDGNWCFVFDDPFARNQ